MNTSIVQAALADLESKCDRARGAQRQIEAQQTGETNTGGTYEDPGAALTALLTDLYEILLVVLEAAELPQARTRLIDKWHELAKGGGIGASSYNSQFDYLECPTFEYIDTLIEGLRIASGDAISSHESYELAKLEAILRKTPVLLKRRGITPKGKNGEKEVRDVMHDYLNAFFTDYIPSPKIYGDIKNFVADCGVRKLRVAIEFKYADSREKFMTCLGGIFEDGGGYNGSLDWTRFYTLIYQTEAFESEGRVRSELTRAGLLRWTAILVTGAGEPAKRRSGKKE